MPDQIRSFSAVNFFPYEVSFGRLLQSNRRFKSAIGYLCAFEKEDDKLETVAKVLLAVWINSEKMVEISTSLKTAKQDSPNYIRDLGLSGRCQLRSECVIILDNIPNFSYSFEKGFLRWSYMQDLESGTLGYDCSDPTFEKFQEILIKQKPKDFNGLEGVLLS